MGTNLGIDLGSIKDFFARQDRFSDSDIKAITAYNAQLKAGVTAQTAFRRTMSEASTEVQNMAARANGNTVALENMTKASKAAEFGMKALSVAGNMLVMFSISFVASQIAKAANAEKEAVQTAREAADVYKNSSSTMDDYISRYSQLREQLLAAKGNEEETYNVKKQLLDLQTELNEKYGEEHGYLNLVTDTYKDQTAALKELNKETANKYLNENRKGIKKATKKMEQQKTYYLGSVSGISNIEDVDAFEKIKELAASHDIEFNGLDFQFTGNASEAYESIHNFMTDIRLLQDGMDNIPSSISSIFSSIFDYSEKSLSDSREILDEYQEIYTQAQMAQIASDASLLDGYNEAVSAVEAYNEAVLRSEDPYNDENVKKAWNYLQTVKQGIQDNKEQWGQYAGIMDNVFSAANDNVYSFYQALQNDNSLAQMAEDLKGLSDTDLSAMANDGNNGDAFDKLYAKAKDYGLEVRDLIDLLTQFGYVQGEVANPADESETTSPLSFQDAWSSLDTTEDSSLEGFKERILALKNAGQLTLEEFQETEGAGSFLSMLGIEEGDTDKINELITQIDSLKTSSEQLASMKKGFTDLSDNLKMKEDNPGQAIGEDVLAGMDEGLKKQTKEWKRYKAVLGDASSSMEDVQEVTDALSAAYIANSGYLADVTYENKENYISELEAMNISDARTVVEEELCRKYKQRELMERALQIVENDLANSANGVSDAAMNEVNSLLETEGATYGVRNAVLAAVEAKKIFAATDMGLSSKMSDLETMIALTCGLKYAMEFSARTGGHDEKGNKLNLVGDEVVNVALDIISKAKGVTDPSGNSTDGRKKGGGQNTGGNTREPAQEQPQKQFSETFNWIERFIKRLQTAFDRWVKQAEAALTSDAVTRYYKSAAYFAKAQMDKNAEAYGHYMYKANKSAEGINLDYIARVQKGGMDIEEVKDEETANKIKSYQEWYEKAQEAMDAFREAAEKLANIPLDKAARKAEIFSDSIDLIDKKIENITDAGKKNKLIEKRDKKEEKIRDSHKAAKTETKDNLNAARKTLSQANLLDADDGITDDERKKIQKALKDKKEVNLSYFEENSEGYRAAVKYNEELRANTKAIQEAAMAEEEYKRKMVESAKQRFDNIAESYSRKQQGLSREMSAKENKISGLEAAGRNVNISYYRSEKYLNKKMLTQYKSEKKDLQDSIKYIKKGTDEWYEAQEKIQDVNDSIAECTERTYELNNAISQLHFDLFDDVSEGIGRISAEQEFLRGLFAHEKKVDTETGSYTDAGLANLGTLSAEYYASQENTKRDKSMLKSLEKVKKEGKQKDGSYKLGKWTFNSLKDLQAKIDETYTKYQNDIKQTYSLESSIADAVKEKYQAELDMVKELIDAKKEALDTEKDLHDYSRTLNEKTNNITTLQKQIAAYSGDTSQEGRARLQKLQKELADKKDDLKETEYNRYISDQKAMLDKLYTEYEETISDKMDDFMTLVEEGLGTVDKNMAEIRSYLRETAKNYGYTFETKNIYNDSKGSIEKNTKKAVKSMEEQKKKQSGTKKNQKEENSILRDKVDDYIRKKASKADKKKGEYSAVNQKIFDDKANSYKGSGKVLSKKELKELAKILGVKYDNGSKKGNLYKKLVEIGYIKEEKKSGKDKKKKQLESAKAYIKKHASKAKKKKGTYDDVNQKIFEDGANSYKGSGKVLSEKEMKGLAKLLGVKYDGGKKGGELYKKLVEIGLIKEKKKSSKDKNKKSSDKKKTNNKKSPDKKKTNDKKKADSKNKKTVIKDTKLKKSVNQYEKIISQMKKRKKSSGIKHSPLVDERWKEVVRGFSEAAPNKIIQEASLNSLWDVMRPERQIDTARSMGSMNNVVNIDTLTLPNVTNYDEFRNRMFRDMQNNRKYAAFINDISINRIDNAGMLTSKTQTLR